MNRTHFEEVDMIKINIPAHMLVAASAWVSRIIVASSQLVCIKLLIDTLGIERYSIFSVIIGLSGWFLLGDFGISTSIQNFISEKRAMNQKYQDWIITGAILIVAFSVILVSFFYFVSQYFGAILLKEYSSLLIEQKKILFFYTSVVLILTNMGNLVYKVWYAEHKGYLSNIAPAIASILGLVLVYGVSRFSFNYFDRLFYTIMAFLVPNFAVGIVSFIYWLKKVNCFRVNFYIIKQVMQRAKKFLFFNVMAAGVLQIDYIIMSQTLQAQEIVVYNIATKIMNLIFFVYSAVLLALWPVCAECLAKGQWESVLSKIKKYIGLGSGFIGIASVILIAIMPNIVYILSPNNQIYIPGPFILLLGLYFILRVWTDTFTMILQSVNCLRPFWILVPFQALLSLGFQWLFSTAYSYYGIICGLIVSYLLTVVWGLPVMLYKIKESSLQGDNCG